ncbi:MAG: septal ring lytic transglycosylase RlpA family protein [Parvularculales bacterium]
MTQESLYLKYTMLHHQFFKNHLSGESLSRISFSVAMGILLMACAGCSFFDFGQKTRGVYKVGNPYQIQGVWYHPKVNESYNKVGIASWYGEPFHGRKTANGEIYDADELTAAHKTLPMPVIVRVINLENDRSVVLRVNDRGPFVAGRIIDVSRKAAEVLGFKSAGTARVRVEYLGRAYLGPGQETAIAQKPSLWRDFAPKGDVTVGKAYAAPVAPVRSKTLSGEDYYVQVALLQDYGNVLALQSNLSKIGPVEVLRVPRDGTSSFRIRIGPLVGKDSAQAALASAKGHGHHDAYIVQE